ncbi:MAG: helix-turn-helix transcriptional regulator [Gemmataceae bacterium]|nr:helix-turn-helix transcriptional regulator [Gemmataceae bacterium]
MSEGAVDDELAAKITKLIQERGWNQEDFARISGLNRHTVRSLIRGEHRLRNTTIQSSAKALGLTVSELRSLPVDRLLTRMHAADKANDDARVKRLYADATSPELLAWLERNEDRARDLSPEECDELVSLQGESGPLTTLGVERVIELMARRRDLIGKIRVVAGSEYLNALEQIVDLMYRNVRGF